MAEKIKKKPISFKFNPGNKNNGPKVELKGVYFDEESGEGEQTPHELLKVLETYGFEYDSDDTYIDVIGPTEDALHDVLEVLGGRVKTELISQPGKKGTAYFAKIGDAGPFPGKSTWEALAKAFQAWNKEGRAINGVRLESALNRVLQKINSKRG